MKPLAFTSLSVEAEAPEAVYASAAAPSNTDSANFFIFPYL